MRKPLRPPGAPDPMASVVDRLLAQLPGLQSDRPAPREPFPRSSAVRGPGTSTVVASPVGISPSQVLATWARVLLALTLGLMLARWPYNQSCGLPLFGYLAAVSVLIVAAALGAVSAWRTKNALAHVVALVLMLYGATLTMAELLPRTGYAVRQASWRCSLSGSFSQWVATLPG